MEVSSELSKNFKFLNQGGCAVVAAIVGKQLSELIDVEVLVEPGWDDYGSIREIQQVEDTSEFQDTSDWNNRGVSFRHVVLKVKIEGEWIIFDSDGIQDYYPGEYFDGSLTISEVETIAFRPIGWNKAFDRDQIPEMQQAVAGVFERMAPSKIDLWMHATRNYAFEYVRLPIERALNQLSNRVKDRILSLSINKRERNRTCT